MKINRKPTVLITDDVHEFLPTQLLEMGYEVEIQADLPYSQLSEVIHLYDGIIINSRIKMTRELMGLSPKKGGKGRKLEFIGRLGSGLEIIDLVAAKEMGIHVFSAPEGNKNAVAEHAMGMLLCLANQLLQADRDVRAMQWDREARRGFELEGKKIGIIGFGNNGEAFARKLMGFDVEVLAFDKFKKNYAGAYPFVKECKSIDEVIYESDIISLHVPLDTSTRFMIDANFIKKCKQGVIIINSSRGKCINTSALIEGLKNRKITGACLDVFENEKPATYSESERVMYEKLYQLKQVVLSPHVAGWTHESKYKIAYSLVQQIINLRRKL